MVTTGPALRLATTDDQDAIDALMKASTRALFPAFYNERQTASSVIHIAHVDPMLIADSTYFVIEAEGEIIACGGWSKRDKLFSGSADQEGRARLLDPATEPARVRAMFVRGDWTRRGLGTRILEACEAGAREVGFSKLALMATLPGVPLYERYGFREVHRAPIKLPDGVELECASMEKPVGPSGPAGDGPEIGIRPDSRTMTKSWPDTSVMRGSASARRGAGSHHRARPTPFGPCECPAPQVTLRRTGS